MPRYFLEVSYDGSHYSGFQKQKNSNTIQAEVEKAFQTLHRKPVFLTGSSRTDTGVHALQNYFHFDFKEDIHPQFLYKANAILPDDIVLRNLILMPDQAHARFDAVSREYEYRIYTRKNPFLKNHALYYPYKVDLEMLQQAAILIKDQTSFFAFSKTNTQVSNFNCNIINCNWSQLEGVLMFHIEGNRFLRGMVRLLTASTLQVGRGRVSLSQFENYFKESCKTKYSVPPHGLFLKAVKFPSTFIP